MDYGLYFHIPFCLRKCIYCDFLSFPRSSLQDDCEERYFTALKNEWQIKSSYTDGFADTVYIGGGTPSAVNPKRIADILNDIRSRVKIRENAEITVEVNPGTVSYEHFKIYKDAGVNRISIGVQSTQERLLKQLGRIHSYSDCEEAVLNAQRAGIDNISCDLIFGIPSIMNEPGQTFEELAQDIERLISLGICHISAYSIIIEDNTPLKELYDCGKAQDIDAELERGMYYYINERLYECGFHRYEISNYAKQGMESRHNMRYWECRPYLGMGLGAASYFPKKSGGDCLRSSNTLDISEYINGKYDGECELINEKEQKSEFMLLGFRKISGPSHSKYQERFGTSYYEDFKDILAALLEKGLIYKEKENMRLTLLGCDFANEVFREFV